MIDYRPSLTKKYPYPPSSPETSPKQPVLKRLSFTNTLKGAPLSPFKNLKKALYYLTAAGSQLNRTKKQYVSQLIETTKEVIEGKETKEVIKGKDTSILSKLQSLL
jgi:hypothetical protein